MKVLHLCLSCFYIDNAAYQENLLVRQHVNDGHEVRVIASTETFDGRGGLTYLQPTNYLGSDGAQVERIPYTPWLPHRLASKLRIHFGLYSRIKDFAPDALLFHGCQGREIMTVAKYVKDHPEVFFYVDNHSDLNNSARGWVSRHILHGMLYRWWFRRALPVVNKVLCISTETMALLENVYGAPKNMLELYPLGGFVLSRSDREDRRRTTRQQHGWEVANFIFLQSGKMTNRKKLIESLIAFKNIPGDHLRFVIVGLLTDEVRGKVESLISSDPRILFLGWKSSEELTGLLCAADVYVQPGTQSATMQHALCCGCPVIIDDVPAHRVYADADVTLIGTEKALEVAMANALTWDGEGKSKKASTFARERLDYKVLANRILTR